MGTTITNLDIGDYGYPDLPMKWTLNVDADDASTRKIVKVAEPGKRHWIESLTAIAAPEEGGGDQWFKILADNDLLIGPVYMEKGRQINLRFIRAITCCSGKNISVRTKSDFSLLLIIEGYTDAYGDFVSSPSPADGATGVGIAVELAWESPAFITNHNVYMGTLPGNLVLIETTPERMCNPGVLSPNAIYYWRVDASDGQTTVTGKVWSFTTI